jgi:hypothetical protein
MMVVVFLNDIFSYVTVLAAVSWWAPIGSSRAAVDKDSLHLVHLAASGFVKMLFLIFEIESNMYGCIIIIIIIIFSLCTAAFKAYCAIFQVPTFATGRL